MANRYWVGGNGTWDNSTTTNWSTTSGGAGGASVPLSIDAAIVDGNSGLSSGIITIGASVNCLSLTTSGASGTLSLINGGSNPINIFGNYAGGGEAVGGPVVFHANATITGGNGYSSVAFANAGAITISLGDNETLPLSGFGGVPSGQAINVNGHQLTLPLNFTGASGTTFTLGAGGTVVVTGTFNLNGTTFSGASGTIETTGPAILTLGGATVGALVVEANTTITGNNSFGTFACNAAGLSLGNTTITLGNGSTQTITTASGLTLNGDASDIITINSDSPGVQATFSMASGTCTGAYLSLKDNNATGGATFNAGVGSVLVSHVTGWNFSSAAPYNRWSQLAPILAQ